MSGVELAPHLMRTRDTSIKHDWTEPQLTSTSKRTQYLRPNTARTPYFSRTEQAGAIHYEPYNNTYWPRSYGRDRAEEFQAIMERAVLIDVGCERTVELRGPDALAFADYLCTRNLQTMKPNRARHTVVCEPNGVIFCEAIVVKLAEDRIWIGHGPVDFPEWCRAIHLDTSFDVRVELTQVFPLAVQGPRAYEIMQQLVPEAADMKFFQWTRADIAGVDSIIVRSGYTGAFGFEIYPFDPDEAPTVWDVVVEAGGPYGMMITPMVGPNFERAVTDYRHGDLLDLNPFEARLERAVNMDKESFVGKAALQRILDAGVKRQMLGARFHTDQPLPVLEEYWPIRPISPGEPSPGVINWAINSFILNEPIGYAIVSRDLSPGQTITVEHPAGTVQAELVELPFMD
jgi:glycine cleavage system aminomethyltransferase T